MVLIQVTGGPDRHLFHDFALQQLSKLCFPLMAGIFFLLKIRNFGKARVCETAKVQRKHSMAYETYKFAGVMHAVVVADGALEAKCARDSSHRPFLKSSRSGKIAI